MNVILLPVLRDNYCYILRCEASGMTAVVDPAEAKPVVALLERAGWTLNSILCTHHHFDHVAGVRELVQRYSCPVYGYAGDEARLPGLSDPLNPGDRVRVGDCEAEVLFVPGHTSGHIAYYFADGGHLFCGDALFAGGCGRLFEGTAAELYHSLNVVLGVLPDETLAYCGHEYTLSNLRFALSVEPNNQALLARFEQAQQTRADGHPTIPSTLAEEKATNPFMRCDSPEIHRSLQKHDPSLSLDPASVFGATRRLKDSF